MKIVPLFLLIALSVKAQLPIMPQMLLSSAASTSPSSYMTNLAEAWEFISLTTNQVAISWTGRIQNTVVTNGSTSRQPSNSAIGLRFTGNQNLTNFTPFSLGGTNYTVSMFLRFTAIRDAGLNVNDSIMGSNSLNTGGYWGPAFTPDVGAGKVDMYIQKSDNTTLGFVNPIVAPMADVWDFVYTMSNNANGGGGHGFLWTNGVFVGVATGGADTTSPQFSFIGAGPLGFININGVGQSNFIQGIYIQTNYASTALNASNIHYYRTNVLTPGASP